MAIKRIVLCVYLLFAAWTSCHAGKTLEQVQVLFRHGERTPEIFEVASTDGENEGIEEPYGWGQLTNRGKMQEYKLGQMLKARYFRLLGPMYRPGDVYARSSNYDRTKASLQLVLAALFPPVDSLVWNNNLNWMPIPYDVIPRQLDNLFFLGSCPRYDILLKQLMKTPEVKNLMLPYRNLIRYLSKDNPNVKYDLEQLFFLNNLLTIQINFNLTLPRWYEPEVHAQITKAAKLYLDILSYTPELIKLNGGGFARRFIENMNLDGSQEKSIPKMYLYSGHEYTVYAMAKAHGITLPKSPAFGSAFILEKLSTPDGEVFVRVLYWTGVTEELKIVKLECGEMCHIDEYLSYMHSILPTKNDMQCLAKNVNLSDIS